MTELRVQCPSCSKLLDVPDSRAGQVVNCPACGGQMQIPEATEAAEAAVPAAAIGTKETVPSAPAPAPATAGAAAETRSCPYCGETILKVAKKCKHCGSFLAGPGAGLAGRSRAAGRFRDRMRKRASGDGRSALIFGLIGLIPICTMPVFAGLAVIYGLGARKNESERTVATIGMILGIVELAVLALGVLASIMMRGM